MKRVLFVGLTVIALSSCEKLDNYDCNCGGMDMGVITNASSQEVAQEKCDEMISGLTGESETQSNCAVFLKAD